MPPSGPDKAGQTPDTHVQSSVNFRKFFEIAAQSARPGGRGNGKGREGGRSVPWEMWEIRGNTADMFVHQTPRMPLCGRDKGCYLVEMEQASLGWGGSLAFDEKTKL